MKIKNFLIFVFIFIFYFLINDNSKFEVKKEIILNIKEQTNLSKESRSSKSNFYVVKRVIDGDTILVEDYLGEQKVRLIGVNTPESVDKRKKVECFGLEASQFSKENLLGKNIRLEKDSSQLDVDKYGRLLRYVFLDDGRNFNQILIEEGYGYEYTYSVPYKYQREFKDKEKFSKENSRGLWAKNACDIKK